MGPNFERHYRYSFFVSRVAPVIQERFYLLRLYYIFYNRHTKNMFTIGGDTIANVVTILQQLSGVTQGDLFTDVLVIGRFRVYEENVRALTMLLQDQMHLQEMESQMEGEDQDPAAVIHEALGEMNNIVDVDSDPTASNNSNTNNSSMNNDPMNGGRRRFVRRRKTMRHGRKKLRAARKSTRRH
jgi:hypothetical protein